MSWLAYITIWTAGLIGTVLALADNPWSMTGWVLLLLGAYLITLAAGVRHPEAGFFFSAINRGPHEIGAIALTFEGGPHPKTTPRLLDLLRQEKIPAAFFPLGAGAAAKPDLIRRLDKEGHLLGGYVFQARWSWRWLTDRGLREEFDRTRAALAEAIQRQPHLVRLPLGVARPGLRRLLHGMQLTGVCWDVRSRNAGLQSPAEAAALIAHRVRNGSIVALSEPAPGTSEVEAAAALEITRRTIALLRDRGFTFVRLDQLLGLSGDEAL